MNSSKQIDGVINLMKEATNKISHDFIIERSTHTPAELKKIYADRKRQSELEEQARLKALNGARDPYSNYHETQWS